MIYGGMTVRQRRRSALVVDEFDSVDLGDPRRDRRATIVAGRLAAQPDATLPGSMEERALLEGLYRHLSSKAVTFGTLLEPHAKKCASRVNEAGDVYAVHDTTVCTFPGEAHREGLGRINEEEQGFLAHVTLAVTADGDRIPLGVLATELLTRGEKKNRRSSKKRKKDGTRESLRWARGVERASCAVTAPERLIHVADREGDIYELLAELRAKRRRFIIRAAQNRPVELDGVPSKLFDAAQETAPAYTLDVPLSRRTKARWTRTTHPPRNARTAQLTIAALTVALRRPGPCSREFPESLPVHAVHVFEVSAPPGETPVEWLLLTSEPIGERAQIERVLQGYRTRWTIEDYFKTVKTGCAYEKRQLESFHALSNLLAYTLVVAYALLLMRALARANRTLPADAILTPSEIQVLRRVKHARLPAEASVRDALLAIAALGGHIKNNGDPGWQVLSRGWQRLRDYDAGYRMACRDL